MAHAGIGADVEGLHAVAAAMAAGRVRELLVEGSRAGSADVAPLVDEASATGASVRLVDDVRPMATTGAPQGVVARCVPIPTREPADLLELADPVALLVLDHVEDPRNVGAIARSALAAGMTGVVVSTRRSAPLGATAFKAAAGALEHLPVATVSSIPEGIRHLGREGVWSVGLDGGAPDALFGLGVLSEPVAICLGAEGAGLSRLVAERCDVLARIPMVGAVESLNASVAAALACFEVARMRGWVT